MYFLLHYIYLIAMIIITLPIELLNTKCDKLLKYNILLQITLFNSV